MIATSFENAEGRFSDLCESAANGESVVITRKDDRNVAVISANRFEELKRCERWALNELKIQLGREQIASGRGIVKSIEELEAMAEDGV